MSLITSTENAALLDAGRLATELAQRYRYSIDHLIEPESLCRLLGRRSDELEALAETLADIARNAGLLPREPDLEMSELRTLADQFSSWLDDDTCSKLLERLAESERELLDELATARDNAKSERNRVLHQAREDTQNFLDRLAER